MSMKLVEFVSPRPHPLWKLCKQMGIDDVIVKVNPDLTGLADPWRYETLSKIVEGLKAAGLTVVGLEGDPFDMTPIKEYGITRSAQARTGMSVPSGNVPLPGEQTLLSVQDTDREEALAHYRELLESMARLGIKLLCYNFMVGKGWSRSGVREGRGGAKATYFSVGERTDKSVCAPACVPGSDRGTDKSVCAPACVPGSDRGTGTPACGEGGDLILTKDQVWANYEYFIKAVMPTAERLGIRMGLHPDDPCLPSLGGYARIFETVADYDRAYAIYPSPSNAVTFCQANFKLMIQGTDRSVRAPTEALIETARHFGNRIAFIHVRDVEGDKYDFTELFHDQGDVDQFALMRAYREIGLDVPRRGDHVPEMEGDRKITEDAVPGYFCLGRLFANGYLKALLQGTENCAGKPVCTSKRKSV